MFTHFCPFPLSDTKLYDAKHLFSMFLCWGLDLVDMDSKTELRTFIYDIFHIFIVSKSVSTSAAGDHH